jgi:hypothetical protein
MLRLNEEAFSCGRSVFLDHDPAQREPTAKVFVWVSVAGLQPQLARLDTGAAWSVLGAEIASVAGIDGGSGDQIELRTFRGTVHGRLERVPVTLIADDGDSLDMEGTFLVTEDWPTDLFLGYAGFLESIRFALDPPNNAFYFGPPGA